MTDMVTEHGFWPNGLSHKFTTPIVPKDVSFRG